MKIFLALSLLVVAMTSPIELSVGSAWSDAAGYEECDDWVDPSKPLPKAIKDICGPKLECAGHQDVANTNCGYGVRKIMAGKWVGTDIDLSQGWSDYGKAFQRLFGYISGANADGAKIDMTAPVIYKSYYDSSYKLVKVTMHFFVPSSLTNPPAPTSDKVYIEDWDAATVYYRAIGKSTTDISTQEWEQEAMDLVTALNKDGVSFYSSMSIVGGFTEPWSPEQRTEIMFSA